MTLRARVLTGIRWTATARLASQLVSWAVTLIVVRILSPSDYGLVAMAMVFVAFVSMFSQFGLGPALVQIPQIDERLLRQGFGAILVINVSLAAILALAAPLVMSFYDEPRVVPLLRVLALQFVLGAFSTIPDAQLQRRMEFRKRSLLDLSSAVLGSVTTLVLALAGYGPWALILGSLASQLWSTAGLQYLSPFLRRPLFSIRGLRPLIRFGGQVTVAQIFGVFYLQVDMLICAKLLGKEIAGFYSVAMQVASMPVYRVSAIVNQVAFPAFSSIQHDRADVADKTLLGVRLLGAVAFPVMWGLSSVAREFVEVVLGHKWYLATFPLEVLTLVLPLRMIGGFIMTAVQGLGRSDIILQNTIWAAGIGTVLFFCGAYWGGLTGLSLVWLLVPLLIVLPNWIRSVPAMGLTVKEVIREIALPAAAGVGMYGAVAASRTVLIENVGSMARLGLLVVIGAIVYCALSMWWNRKGALELVRLARSIGMPGQH
jgi:O-antigen/teichoic acid export membrane protein